MKNFFLISSSIIVLDQITKFLFKDVHYGIFNYVTNTGAAFSLFSEYTMMLTIISFLISNNISHYF